MKPFRNFLVASALLLTVLSLYIPVRYQVSYPREIGPQFDDRIRRTYINILDEQQPDMLLFGDSMLAPAVDEGFVESRVGLNIHTVSLPGTASTLWYLILKNNIVLAEHKPAYLVMFFRDTMMTLPGYRVTGRYFEQIDEFASPDDRVLIERAYINQMTAPEKFLEANFPLYGSRWTIRQSIDYYIRYPLGNSLLQCDQPCMDYSMEAVFAEGNLDITFLSEAIGAADDNLYSDEAFDFNGQVALSFLPEIVRLCRENEIQLVLVRMPIQRFYDAATKPAGLDGYIKDLGTYLRGNNVIFFDFDRKEIPLEFYSDTLHLNEQGRAMFSQELAEALVNIVHDR